MNSIDSHDINELSLPVKQPVTYAEQVAIIKGKGFLVDDENECIEFLHRANYYRLSAYFLPFKKSDGSYCENISFKRIEHIYEFDGRMRSVVLQCIEEIELYLRTQFSYVSAHEYGALGYLNADNYSKVHNDTKFKEHLNRCIEENKRSLVVKHQ